MLTHSHAHAHNIKDRQDEHLDTFGNPYGKGHRHKHAGGDPEGETQHSHSHQHSDVEEGAFPSTGLPFHRASVTRTAELPQELIGADSGEPRVAATDAASAEAKTTTTTMTTEEEQARQAEAERAAAEAEASKK